MWKKSDLQDKWTLDWSTDGLRRWRECMCVSVVGVSSRPEVFSWGDAITDVSPLDLKESTGPARACHTVRNGASTAEQWLTDREPEDLGSSLDLQPALGCLECYCNSLDFKVHTMKLLGHYCPRINYHNESLKWHQLGNLCFFVSDFVWYSRFLTRHKICVSFWNK